MERVSRYRAVTLLIIFVAILGLYAVKLFDLQVLNSNKNASNITTYTTITTVRASRGDILDRNGNVLVGNRASYDLVFNHYVITSYSGTNEALYNLHKKCQELGVEYIDHFPISKTKPFEYTLGEFTTAWQNHFRSFMSDRELDSDVTAPLLIEKLRERYKIPTEWSDEDARAVIAMRYEFDLRGISSLPTYTFIEDVSDEDLSAILELNTPGLMVESSTVREYHTKYAAHILGYLGGMDSNDWAKYKSEGYSMDADIGKAGFEEAFEDYLHGIDGQRVDVVSKDGTIIEQYYRIDKESGKVYTPVAGNNVETTIDIGIQQVAEDALASCIEDIKDPEKQPEGGNVGDGLDAEGAAVVVMNVKTGEILACASYPTYNLATMLDDWQEIMDNPLNPMFNRAFGAYYAPGSTFKMCTLIAAMENMSTNAKSDYFGRYLYLPGEIIRDEGVFTRLAGFNPTCLIWTSNPGVTHGEIDATVALKVSCNFFFYELGYRLSWEIIDDTAMQLGLGEPTGIELTEKTGWRSNPDSKLATYGSGVNATYTAGDRVLSAIGQAENRYTPLQLCVYVSTLANKGTRMKATFLNRVVSADYNELVYENSPQIAYQMEMQSTTINTYFEGMRKVVTGGGTDMWNGTANKFFGGKKDDPKDQVAWKDIAVCAKTGTAEHSSGGSDHGAFVCFAPMEDPEIAIAVYGEKAAHGNWLCPIAEDILQYYFAMESASEVTAFENQVA